MHPPGARTVLVRHRELGTKSHQVQRRMERVLANNLDAMLSLREIPGDVRHERGRLFVTTTTSEIDRATRAATNTFGVASASPTKRVPADRTAIEDALAATANAWYDGGSFAVRARRAGPPDAHAFTSIELEECGGAAIWDAVADAFDPVVDLDDPTYTFSVECRANHAYVFLDSFEGPGGFPVGTQGRVAPLISGGIDSPVAAWEVMRRGCDITPIYFDFEEYGGPDHVARAVESVRRLAGYAPGHRIELHVAPIGDAVDRLLESVDNTRMLSLRRLMFAVADRIAEAEGAHALVTGESIGQKSSQTGQNLAVTAAHIRRPIHRPLLGFDKLEIIERAKRIGTYEEARINAGCNRVAPRYPATHATHEEIHEAEPAGFLDAVPSIIERTESLHIRPLEVDPDAIPV